MTSFAQSPMSGSLDAIGQRYGIRPSALMDMPPDDPRSLLMDFAVAAEAMRAEALREGTVGGKIMGRRAGWNPEVLREVEEQRMQRMRGAGN